MNLFRSGLFRWQFWGDFGNVTPNFFHLILAPLGDQVPGSGLGGKQSGAQKLYFQLGAGPFPVIEGVYRQFQEQMIG